MIDGIKISFRSEGIEDRLKCLDVEVFSRIINSTGEVVKQTAKHRHLTIVIYPSNTVIIKGSLHKYWEGENYSDFSHSALVECIDDLSVAFGFDPAEAWIQNLEFGVNIDTLFNPYEFCESVIAHKGRPFSQFQTNGMQIGFQCYRSQYAVKVYDKGKQYLKNENKLRFEIKTNKMVLVKSSGITRLSDLSNKNNLIALGNILQSAFKDLIITDHINEAKLTKNERRIFNQCINPKIWGKFNKNDRYYKRKQFNNIVEKHGTNQWKKTVAQKLDEKWRMLLVLQTKN